jgi:hypothetical protein
MASQIIIDDLAQFQAHAIKFVAITEAARDALVVPAGERWEVWVLGVGKTAWNGVQWVLLETSPVVPSQVAGLSLTSVSTTRIDATWNPIGGATYEVERSDNGTTGWVQIGAPVDPVWQDTTVTVGQRKYYRVRGVNSEGAGSYSAVADTYARPAVPANINALPNLVGRIDVTVDPVATAVAYNLYAAPSSGGTFALVDTQPLPALSEVGLGNSVIRYYKVTAVNPGGEGGLSAEDSAQTNPAPSSLFAGLEVAYQLADVNDSFGALNLTNTNGVSFAAGSVGNAASFTAASLQRLSRADTPALRFGGVRDFTLACRVKAATLGADRAIVSKYTTGSSQEFMLRYSNSLARFNAVTADGGVHSVVATAAGAPALGVWHTIIVRYDRVQLKIRVNGVENVLASTSVLNANTAPFLIGAAGATPTDFWNGQIDEVYKWNRAISDAECSVYESGLPYPF